MWRRRVNLATARGLLLGTRPDVVFLDIRLGKASGFDLLEEVDEETAVVFVTAYEGSISTAGTTRSR